MRAARARRWSPPTAPRGAWMSADSTHDLADLPLRDPKGAATAIEAAAQGPEPVQQGEFDRHAARGDLTRQRTANTPPAGMTDAQKELGLDLTQMGLDVAGLFDPTPISHGANGGLSLLRGDRLGAGISAVSMILYLGDAAKLGKLGKWGKTVMSAIEMAKTDSAFAKAVGPALGKISDATGAAPKAPLRPPCRQSARDTLNGQEAPDR